MILHSIRYYLWLIWMSLFASNFASCQSGASQSSTHQTMVGFIPHNPELDDPNFTLCREGICFPYYSFEVNKIRNKNSLSTHFKEKLKYQFSGDLNAYLTVRFIINCKGETGRFRKEAMNKQYEEVDIDEEVWKEFIAAIKSYKDWKMVHYQEDTYDYNIYVTLKIEEGKLTEILP